MDGAGRKAGVEQRHVTSVPLTVKAVLLGRAVLPQAAHTPVHPLASSTLPPSLAAHRAEPRFLHVEGRAWGLERSKLSLNSIPLLLLIVSL